MKWLTCPRYIEYPNTVYHASPLLLELEVWRALAHILFRLFSSSIWFQLRDSSVLLTVIRAKHQDSVTDVNLAAEKSEAALCSDVSS